MKNFFCFVTSDSNKTAHDILLKRIKDKQWVTYEKTQHSLLKKEDEIIFYIAGKNIYKQSFLGRAQIENVEKPHEAIIDPDNPKKEVFMIIRLKKIIIFKNPILVKEIINNLDFIKNKKNWGMFFHGGIREIEKKDFDFMVNYNPK